MSGRVLAAALALLIQGGLTAAQAQAPGCQAPPGLSFPAVSSTLPYDATLGTQAELQQAFDIFSWASFVALNWPSNPDGTPMDGPITSNPTAPRVWEAYIDASGVFKSQGAPPDPWGGTNTFLASLATDYKQGRKVLFSPSKDVLSLVNQANFGKIKLPPIADLNGKYVFYEIHLNKPEYDYIVCPTQPGQLPCPGSINLYSLEGQTAFLSNTNAAISFPQGSSSAMSYGAIEVKAAWKQLGPGDDPTKFYTVVATLIDPVTGDQIPDVTMGLVGLHIITRTNSAPQWVWSTFEHVANAPDAPTSDAQPPPPPAGSHFNFNDPTKTQPASGYGFQPQNTQPVANPQPTQITRVLNNTLINNQGTQCLNSTMQANLTGTVWANYRLVTTQWPALNKGVLQFIPSTLTNTTMETYVQNQGGSCMDCHSIAQTAGTQPNNNGPAPANFSYLLQQAQPTTGAPAMLRSRRR
jgi:hypothetical protein